MFWSSQEIPHNETPYSFECPEHNIILLMRNKKIFLTMLPNVYGSMSGEDLGFLEREFICIKGWGFALLILSQVQIQRGDRGSGPPVKSQVLWVSIGNKKLDSLEKVGPPPPPWKMLDPLWNLKNVVFFEINHSNSVK